MSSPARRFRENIPSITAVLVTGIWLGALFTGQEWWLAFMLVGYVAILPIVSILFEDEEEAERDQGRERAQEGRSEPVESGTRGRDAERTVRSPEDALQTLRDRYARGELTDEQFERKLERLLETETLEDVAQRTDRPPSRDRNPETEFER